jgi:hypothetical protein
VKRFLLTALCLSSLAVAADTRVRFEPGANYGIVEGAVARGETRRYVLGARAGQTMSVAAESAEQNVVFQVTAPNGGQLKGARDGDDARSWKGRLPQNGDYVLSVGTTRGGGEYRITISID